MGRSPIPGSFGYLFRDPPQRKGEPKKDTMRAVAYVGWPDRTWTTLDVEIPRDIHDDEIPGAIEEAARELMDKQGKEYSFVGPYREPRSSRNGRL